MPVPPPLRAVAGAACLAACAPAPNAATSHNAVAPIPGEAGLAAFLDCLDDADVTLVSAHRGGPAPGYPENAIATFENTLHSAPALLEVDVRATRDGELVLLHDDDLDRTTTCSGPLAQASFEDLTACRLRDNDGRATDGAIPTLAEALAWSEGRTILQLDVKPSAGFDRVIEEIRTADAADRAIVVVFTAEDAGFVAAMGPELVISAPVYDEGDLDDLFNVWVGLERIVAWTGNRAPNADLNAHLETLHVPAFFGTLGAPESSIDGDIERSGDDARYVDIARQGVDILATDRPIAAYRALAADRDPADAIAVCQGARP